MTGSLYEASVPVVQHYLEQSSDLIRMAGSEDVLNARLAPDMFSAGEQFATAAGFAHQRRLRVTLAGDADSCEAVLEGPAGEITRARSGPVTGRAVLALEFEPAEAGFVPLTVRVTAASARP